MRATDHALAGLSTRWSGWSPRRRSAAILATLWATPIVLTILGLAFVTQNYDSQYPPGTCSSYSTGPNYAMWVVVAANAVAAIGSVATFVCPGLRIWQRIVTFCGFVMLDAILLIFLFLAGSAPGAFC
jgi:hypothetical protein